MIEENDRDKMTKIDGRDRWQIYMAEINDKFDD